MTANLRNYSLDISGKIFFSETGLNKAHRERKGEIYRVIGVVSPTGKVLEVENLENPPRYENKKNVNSVYIGRATHGDDIEVDPKGLMKFMNKKGLSLVNIPKYTELLLI